MKDVVEYKITGVEGLSSAVAWVEEHPVHPVRKVLKCWCGQEMTSTGLGLTSIPMQYPHRCSNGHMTVAPHPTVTYPHIAYD